MKLNLKRASLIVILWALTLPVQAGIFFDDPLEMSLNWKPHLIGKDQVSFAPSGKHEHMLLLNAYYTIEVKYQDHTTTFTPHDMLVCGASPLVIDLPEGLKGIKEVSLKAKWSGSVLIGRFKKDARLPVNPTPKELADSIAFVKGLKVDSSWTVK